MGIGRICLLSRWTDTRIVGDRNHRDHSWIAATTDRTINLANTEKAA